MTLRQKIEERARLRYINMHDHPIDRGEAQEWWDSSGDDTIKEDMRHYALQEMLDEEY